MHAHVVAKECLAHTSIEQVSAEQVESLRFLPQGFGLHYATTLAWLV